MPRTIDLNCAPYGTIKVDETGYPLTSLPSVYSHVSRFDLDSVRRICINMRINHGELNAHHLGYWTDDGKYHRPLNGNAEKGIWWGRFDRED